MDEKVRQIEFDSGDNESGEYKVEAIWDSTVYVRESELGHLLGLYYLVSWKRYPEEENTWEPALVVQHLRKLISSFYKDHPDKPTATSPTINTVSPMASPTIKSTGLPKQKRRRPTNITNKQTKTNWDAFEFCCIFGWIWVTPMLDISSCNTRDYTWLHVAIYDVHSTFIKTSFKVLTFLAFLALVIRRRFSS